MFESNEIRDENFNGLVARYHPAFDQAGVSLPLMDGIVDGLGEHAFEYLEDPGFIAGMLVGFSGGGVRSEPPCRD